MKQKSFDMNIYFLQDKFWWMEEQTLLDILLLKYSHTCTYEGFMLFIFLITLMEVVTEFESSCWDIQHPKNIATGIYLTF